MTPKLTFQKVPLPTHYPLVCNYILPATVAAEKGDRNCLLRLHLKIGTKKTWRNTTTTARQKRWLSSEALEKKRPNLKVDVSKQEKETLPASFPPKRKKIVNDMKCKVAALGRNFQTLFSLEKKTQVVVAFSPGKVFFSRFPIGSFTGKGIRVHLTTKAW